MANRSRRNSTSARMSRYIACSAGGVASASMTGPIQTSSPRFTSCERREGRVLTHSAVSEELAKTSTKSSSKVSASTLAVVRSTRRGFRSRRCSTPNGGARKRLSFARPRPAPENRVADPGTLWPWIRSRGRHFARPQTCQTITQKLDSPHEFGRSQRIRRHFQRLLTLCD